jgi:hypothetical protein
MRVTGEFGREGERLSPYQGAPSPPSKEEVHVVIDQVGVWGGGVRGWGCKRGSNPSAAGFSEVGWS